MMSMDYRIALVAALCAIVVWASSRILKRMGFSPWWATLSFITPLNVIGLTVLALFEWPIERNY
jgi:hypothetical protein